MSAENSPPNLAGATKSSVKGIFGRWRNRSNEELPHIRQLERWDTRGGIIGCSALKIVRARCPGGVENSSILEMCFGLGYTKIRPPRAKYWRAICPCLLTEISATGRSLSGVPGRWVWRKYVALSWHTGRPGICGDARPSSRRIRRSKPCSCRAPSTPNDRSDSQARKYLCAP